MSPLPLELINFGVHVCGGSSKELTFSFYTISLQQEIYDVTEADSFEVLRVFSPCQYYVVWNHLNSDLALLYGTRFMCEELD